MLWFRRIRQPTLYELVVDEICLLHSEILDREKRLIHDTYLLDARKAQREMLDNWVANQNVPDNTES